MRTSFLITAALLASTGCTPGDVAFDHTSSLQVAARGLEYTDDDSAQVGMYGNTCAVDPDTSSIGEDNDVVDDDDRVEDAFENKALIANGTGVRVYDPSAWSWDMDAGADFVAPSLQDSGFVSGGVVLLDAFQGCNLTFHTQTTAVVTVDTDACVGATLASNGAADTVALAVGGEALLADASGAVTTLGAASHVAIDADNALALAGSGSTLTAFDFEGAEQWSVELGGDITSLDMLGDRAAIMIAAMDGTGELVTVDATGAIGSSLVTPAPADAIVGSASGSELAMIVANTVHFFEAKSLD